MRPVRWNRIYQMNNKNLTKQVGDITNLDDIEKIDEFLAIVNHAPPEDYVFNHPIAKGVKFIPIGVVETMLTKLFRYWNVEILREGQLLNSIFVTVRLHYKHPVSGEMIFQDGVGAVAIQTEKDKDASDMAAIKSNAIMLALPAAKSFAIKDAAEHIGKAFGRDMNRKDTLVFNTKSQKSNLDLTNKLVKVEQIKTLAALAKEYSGLTDDEAEDWFKEIIGCQYSQVKQFEFDYVVQKLSDERIVY